MAAEPLIFSSVPAGLLDLLTERLPTSLTLLRRLQFTTLLSSTSPHERIVFASDTGTLGNESSSSTAQKPNAFTVMHIDMSGGPDTQAWMYSSLEDDRVTGVADGEYDRQLDSIIQTLIRLKQEYGKELTYQDGVLLGSLHYKVRNKLELCGRIRPRITGDYDKWLFRDEALPQSDVPLPEGMHWDRANLSDCHVVVSKTDIPRRAEKLVQWPSLTIKLEDDTPIAWAFLGPDAALASLHCEEPYRRRGLAKTLAAKLLREGTRQFGSDGWSSADVSADNHGSRAMCGKLNGEAHWVVSWVLLDLSESI